MRKRTTATEDPLLLFLLGRQWSLASKWWHALLCDKAEATVITRWDWSWKCRIVGLLSLIAVLGRSLQSRRVCLGSAVDFRCWRHKQQSSPGRSYLWTQYPCKQPCYVAAFHIPKRCWQFSKTALRVSVKLRWPLWYWPVKDLIRHKSFSACRITASFCRSIRCVTYSPFTAIYTCITGL